MPELAAFRVTDRDAWNAFVEHAPYRSFPQLWEWGELREPSGWRPIRIAVGERPDQPLAGAQILVRHVPVVGWGLGYAPRGPVGHLDDPATRQALIAAVLDLATTERIATLKVDPEATADDPWPSNLFGRGSKCSHVLLASVSANAESWCSPSGCPC